MIRNHTRTLLAAFMLGLFVTAIVSSFGLAQAQLKPLNGDAIKPIVVPNNADGDAGITKPESPIASWTAKLNSAIQATAREGISAFDLDELEVTADSIVAEAKEFAGEFEPERASLKSQIDELGPKPKDGESEEDEVIAKRREALNAGFSKVDGEIKAARLAIIRSTQLKAQLSKIRRDRFVGAISERSISILHPDLIGDFISGVPTLAKSMRLLIKDSTNVLVKRLTEKSWKIGALAAIIAVGIGIFWYVRNLVFQFRQRTYTNQEESRFRKVKLAFLQFLRLGVLNAVFVYFAFDTLDELGLLTRNLSTIISDVAGVAIFTILSGSLAKVFLNPSDGHLRYADLSDSASIKVYRNGMIAIVLFAILSVINASAVTLIAPKGVSVAVSAIIALVVMGFAIRIMMLIASDRSERVHPAFPEKRLFRWRHVRPLIWIAIFAILVTLLLGYLAFSEFAAAQIIVASFVLALLWLILEFFDAGHLAGFSKIKNQSSALTRNTGMRAESLAQFSVLGFGVLKMVAILFAAIALFAPWGVRTNDWVSLVSGAFFGFQVGDLTISISSILMAIGLFLVGYFVTRTIQAWLSNQYLPETRLDLGLRNSISTVLGYIGIVIAAMLAIGAAGIDLSNLAIVAGALSVGVGFGLQSIVSNFVSGLILLAERPIKAGDWVITTGGEGTVKKISVRSTEIETFEKASIIVPNSTLITDPVTNWTHTSKFGRIGIAIGVGYDSDPEQVRTILIDTMKSHPGILGKPEPNAFFLDFGDSALMFEVRGYLSNIENGFSTKSDLRFAIFKALADAKIDIPFPQRVVSIRSEADVPAKAPAKPRKPRK